MASSLLFRIKSVFDSTGFKQAESSFASTLGVVGRLGAAAAKLAISFSALGGVGALLTTILGFRLVSAVFRSGDAAATAEVAFTKLRTQLGLLGLESERNISRIKDFSREISFSTRFTEEAVQEATAIALRRTGDLSNAIKQVSVAQNIAAATGRDLLSTTRLLNLAQSGRAGILLQITNLTREEIREFQKEGTILDELAKRFGGAAAREAGTFAGKLAILQNITEETTETLGELGLPVLKILADLGIAFSRVGLAAAEAFALIQNPAEKLLPLLTQNKTAAERLVDAFATGRGFSGLSDAIRRAQSDTDKLSDSVAKLKTDITSDFDEDRQLELNRLLLDTTDSAERRQVRKDFEETEAAIKRIQDVLSRGGDPIAEASKSLQELKESRFNFASGALDEIAKDITDEDKALQERLVQFRIDQQTRNREAAGIDTGGPTSAVAGIVETVRTSVDNNVSVIQRFAESISGTFNGLSANVQLLADRLFTPKGVFDSNNPTVNVEVNATGNSIRAAVRNAVTDALSSAGLLDLFRNIKDDVQQQAREDSANNSIA